jgi:hypothetical protein
MKFKVDDIVEYKTRGTKVAQNPTGLWRVREITNGAYRIERITDHKIEIAYGLSIRRPIA